MGLPTNARPTGTAPTPHDGLQAPPAVRTAGQPDAAATPGNRSGGDTTPTATDAAGIATSTPGRDELRALLVYLNEVPPDSQTGEAQKLHLHLATRLLGVTSCPPSRTPYTHDVRIFYISSLSMLFDICEQCSYQRCVTSIEMGGDVLALGIRFI